ncbi:hypothetical protein JKP88DRAFT_346667 [Tribonema minus]|uniref:Purple acid phosphatase n=1 Tax=Tribonema minus TaxID=303371 RepID=A0A835YU01_9STRA|nr:hypothetical protein JKP88DRAFT_346667 [Tribonema minus]
MVLLVGSALGVAAGALATLSAESVAVKPRVRPVYLDMFKTEAAVTALEEGIALSVTPTELPSSGSWVEVTWSGLFGTAGNEFIAWYSPASALSDVTAAAPVKYQFLSANCTAPCSEGVLRFRLLNLRDEEGYAAGLFRGGLDAPVIVALTTGGDKNQAVTNRAVTNAAVTFANPHAEVLHPHLALTGVPGEMRVSWVTGTPPAGVSPSQRVQWRDVRSLSSTRERGAETSTYTREDMCDAPATTVGFHDPGLLHSAVMRGLEAGATYEYTISDQFTGRFTMAPERGSRGAVRVAVFGDMGTAEMDGALDTNEQARCGAHRKQCSVTCVFNLRRFGLHLTEQQSPFGLLFAERSTACVASAAQVFEVQAAATAQVAVAQAAADAQVDEAQARQEEAVQAQRAVIASLQGQLEAAQAEAAQAHTASVAAAWTLQRQLEVARADVAQARAAAAVQVTEAQAAADARVLAAAAQVTEAQAAAAAQVTEAQAAAAAQVTEARAAADAQVAVAQAAAAAQVVEVEAIAASQVAEAQTAAATLQGLLEAVQAKAAQAHAASVSAASTLQGQLEASQAEAAQAHEASVAAAWILQRQQEAARADVAQARAAAAAQVIEVQAAADAQAAVASAQMTETQAAAAAQVTEAQVAAAAQVTEARAAADVQVAVAQAAAAAQVVEVEAVAALQVAEAQTAAATLQGLLEAVQLEAAQARAASVSAASTLQSQLEDSQAEAAQAHVASVAAAWTLRRQLEAARADVAQARAAAAAQVIEVQAAADARAAAASAQMTDAQAAAATEVAQAQLAATAEVSKARAAADAQVAVAQTAAGAQVDDSEAQARHEETVQAQQAVAATLQGQLEAAQSEAAQAHAASVAAATTLQGQLEAAQADITQAQVAAAARLTEVRAAAAAQDERASLQTVSLLARMLDPPAAAPQPPLGLVLHIGDISYARGFDVQWDEFFDQIAPVATRIPWMVAPGNHERDAPLPSTSTARPQTSYYRGYDSGGECGVPYSWRLPMPGPGAVAAADAPWYGFDYGPIHFTVMSTEHDFRPGSAQHAFLAADLAACDRSATPWLVFAGHRRVCSVSPMYVDSVGPGADECGPDDPTPCPWDQPVSRELRRAVEPLLLKHEVDLALWGHHHSYQRTCHVVAGRCAAPSAALAGGGGASADAYRGPVHLVVGMAGYELTTNTHAARPPIFEYVNTWEHGVAALDANATHLAAGFYVDATGRLGDAVTLFRPPAAPQAAVSQRLGSGGNGMGEETGGSVVAVPVSPADQALCVNATGRLGGLGDPHTPPAAPRAHATKLRV